MHISKVKTISEIGDKVLLDMVIKLEYSPAEQLIIQEALKNLPPKIQENGSLEIITNENQTQLKFFVDTQKISEEEISEIVNRWLNELNFTLEENKHFLPLMDEILKLKKEVKELNYRVKALESENTLIKEALIKKKIIKEEF
uniref:Uncharacterized protein n=1 Tax=candidate division WOR-3 bacterium TaxID=2052148 RepID=A0A7V6CN12_UNCW3